MSRKLVCPKCGATYTEPVKYCPDDGTPLNPLPERDPASPSPEVDHDARTEESRPEPERDRLDDALDIVAVVRRGWTLFTQDAFKYMGFVIAIAIAPLFFVPPLIWSVVLGVLPILEGCFMYGLIRSLGKEPKFTDAFLIFNRALPLLLARWFPIAVVSLPFLLVRWLPTPAFAVIAFVLFVPTVYLSVAYLLVIPLVLDRDLGVWTAMESSRQRITREWFQAFMLMIVIALINSVGLSLQALGVIITGPLTTCILVAMYEALFGVAGKLPTSTPDKP